MSDAIPPSAPQASRVRLQIPIWMLMAGSLIAALCMAVAGPVSGLGMALGFLLLVGAPAALPRTDKGRLAAGLAVAILTPLLLLLSTFLTWFVAWACLGRMPRPMINDPKSIHPIVDFFHGMTFSPMLSMPTGLLIGPVLGAFLARLSTRPRAALARYPLFCLVLPIGGWVLAFLLSRQILALTPIDLLKWFLD